MPILYCSLLILKAIVWMLSFILLIFIFDEKLHVCDTLFCLFVNHALTLQIVGPLIVPLVPWKGLVTKQCACVILDQWNKDD